MPLEFPPPSMAARARRPRRRQPLPQSNAAKRRKAPPGPRRFADRHGDRVRRAGRHLAASAGRRSVPAPPRPGSRPACGTEDADGRSRCPSVAPSPGGGCRPAPAGRAAPPRMSAGCGREPPRKRARPGPGSPGGGSQGERQEEPGGSSSATAVGNKGL